MYLLLLKIKLITYKMSLVPIAFIRIKRKQHTLAKSSFDYILVSPVKLISNKCPFELKTLLHPVNPHISACDINAVGVINYFQKRY